MVEGWGGGGGWNGGDSRGAELLKTQQLPFLCTQNTGRS